MVSLCLVLGLVRVEVHPELGERPVEPVLLDRLPSLGREPQADELLALFWCGNLG